MKKAVRKTTSKTKPAKTQKTYPVPEYMDDDLKPTAKRLDVLGRHALAEKLERQALQLRGMKQQKVAYETTVAIPFRPQVKRALVLFAERHGAKNFTEIDKLKTGTRWFLESALPRIKEANDYANNAAHYRDSEGLEDSAYSEELIRVAIDAWISHPASVQSDDED